MTDDPPLKTYAGPQLSSAPAYTSGSPTVVNGLSNGYSLPDGAVEDEDGIIKCICGYHNDDGSTVLCEVCNTWQHIICYYDKHTDVPDVHECVDCLPRPLDAKRAVERQKGIRELPNVGDKKVKRAATKSHKKKARESVSGPVQINGWPLGDKQDLHDTTDRKTGAPRDSHIPNKRPKTTHKSSGSIASATPQAPTHASRKRATSVIRNGQSPMKSPVNYGSTEQTSDYFSPEFMQLYRQPEFTIITANSFDNIAVTDLLTEWLVDPNALPLVTNGKTRNEIFSRFSSMEELEARDPGLTVEIETDQSITKQGVHPTWQLLTVASDVLAGGYVGELKGQVGLKHDYVSSSSGRWMALQHPEPFVFFCPPLPIYIDARNEGNNLRYIRRSCRPNVRMQILITEGTQYHFCFIAKRDISALEEVTIGWDLMEDHLRLLSEASRTKGGIHNIERGEEISHWAQVVLGAYGGCACSLPPAECILQRVCFRNHGYVAETTSQNQNLVKSKKLRKNGTQISPLSTGCATNSRAGSETLHRIHTEDDQVDSRSASGSSHSKPGSRDITPMARASTNAAYGLGVQISDREKRKMMAEERLFEQLQLNEQHTTKRRKRNSGASTSNVVNGQRAVSKATQPSRASTTAAQPPPKPKPVYTDASTQTEADNGLAYNLNIVVKRRRPRSSPVQLLLQRAREERERRERSQRTHAEAARSDSVDLRDVVMKNADSDQLSPVASSSAAASSPWANSTSGCPLQKDVATSPAQLGSSVSSNSRLSVISPSATSHVEEHEDVDMKDADTSIGFHSTSSAVMHSATPSKSPVSQHPAQSSHPPIQPPPPPWPATAQAQAPSHPLPMQKTVGLHVQLPPHPPLLSSVSSMTPTTPSVPGALGPLAGSIAQSPSALTVQPPIFSPNVAAAVTPSPMQKKKLSLSDYTSRKKKTEALSAVASSVQAPSESQLPPPQSSPPNGATVVLGLPMDESTPRSLPEALTR
ncbi:hypothetical protein W97_05288 [Coniosporium apollinis CBS 100218]|uniref:SET domain-containing protein n=1 Tax=Coniosporium apollinis (strain CBS 100218) TaxID=1168221 RepID=R7YVV0_CONA1|nr:uncharacterized protein W97_05288 [Coniosporium apollinis CBS 100218]EON66045.1 hypothetical protein W97_05288 [Coniosporium apollinis CBS 100218]